MPGRGVEARALVTNTGMVNDGELMACDDLLVVDDGLRHIAGQLWLMMISTVNDA